MFSRVSERQMHRVRWFLTVGWLLLILSLFYDPWTTFLTQPNHSWSPLRLSNECVLLQGHCVEQDPYTIGATVFWGAVVPAGIFILLIFGHDLWRRICPLSFLSQIPRALGKQHQAKRVNQKTGKVRFEIARVKPDSWLGRNHLSVQFFYLFTGICGRILFFNSNHWVLGGWLVLTILAAITVGYFYSGKSWCQYFCPMALVQKVFSEPRGLLGSKAHMSESRITQSMCRSITSEGKEQSACVACQSPCIDIDSERTYWAGLNNPQELVIRCGYLGLMIGYFAYYYLYAGNWNYYFSGVWSRDLHQLDSLTDPGLYLLGQPIDIPKILAVPLILGLFTLTGINIGRFIARRLEVEQRNKPNPKPHLVRHRLFAVATFLSFNVFFFFGGRPLLLLTPLWVQFLFDGMILFASTLWLRQSWNRSPALYTRENLASRLRRQLEKLNLDVGQLLEGRSLEDLSADEVFVLAKVLPDFTQTKRRQVYRGVLCDALAEGYVSTASSLFMLQQVRKELDVSDNEHQQILEDLGVEDPSLLNPDRQRSLENQIRLSGYQRSLERLIRLQRTQPQLSAAEPLPKDAKALKALRREYSITPQEEKWVLQGLDAQAVPKAQELLVRLQRWIGCSTALTHPQLQDHQMVLAVVQDVVSHKQELIVRSLLELLPALPNHPETEAIAQQLHQLAPSSLGAFLEQGPWRESLPTHLVELLVQPASGYSSTSPTGAVVEHLENLLRHYNPLVATASLYLLAQLDVDRATIQADILQRKTSHALLRDTATHFLDNPASLSLIDYPALERQVYLYNSDFFHGLEPKILSTLADQAEIRTYAFQEEITEEGDTCRELLILMSGEATIHYQKSGGMRVEQFLPGQALDELQVIGHSNFTNTIWSEHDNTRILAVPVDAFDALLDLDRDFARRVLTLESQRIQQLMQESH